LLCIFIGVYPQPLIKTSERDLQVVAEIAGAARERSALQARSSSPTPLANVQEKTQ
jgi:hypothetical protein